ncbi:hypothetical protein F6V30_13985 [Oryzomonas sagensis]|uniref:Uncharacterized protein n=1 Tax=Oryzomonas sagensis TaxID=2603857 RepID=A0ABQ6TLL6_9BACT|nr:hypothetical protein [Oryzomonas sagensis]KAB0668943.1 hypothetical protein F6V30_13985 [Oryzomonas sagensis]
MINVGTAITSALTKIVGNQPRPVFVAWFNEIVQDILRQPREWKFLDEPLTLVITNNQITLPAGVSEIVSIHAGTFFFSRKNQLSDEEANAIDNSGVSLLDQTFGEPIPPQYQGYTLDAAGKVVTFHPAIQTVASATVTAMADITAPYADNQDTIFPDAFSNLFITGLRMSFYDQDKDGRYTKESMLYQYQMSQMKAWDNRRKALPKLNNHGYIRGVP